MTDCRKLGKVLVSCPKILRVSHLPKPELAV